MYFAKAYLVHQTLDGRPQLVPLRVASFDLRKCLVELVQRGAPDVVEEVGQVLRGLQLDFAVGFFHDVW